MNSINWGESLKNFMVSHIHWMNWNIYLFSTYALLLEYTYFVPKNVYCVCGERVVIIYVKLWIKISQWNLKRRLASNLIFMCVFSFIMFYMQKKWDYICYMERIGKHPSYGKLSCEVNYRMQSCHFDWLYISIIFKII